MRPYYTVVIPWVPAGYRTEWHPDTAVGPFSTLTRGAFETVEGAIDWARAHLGGAPYSVKEVQP